MTQLFNLLITALSLSFFAGCQTIHPPGAPSENGVNNSLAPTKITHTLTDYRPFITTHHVTTKPLTWLIDSGASKTIFFPPKKTSASSDLTYTGTNHYRLNGIFQSESLTLQTFELHSQNTPTISGIAVTSQQPPSPNINGILGVDMLIRHRAALHIRDNSLSWNTPKQWPSTHQPVRLKRQPSTKHLILSGHHGNTVLNFIVDTGAKHSLLSSKTAKKLSISSSSTRHSLSGLHGKSHNPTGSTSLSIQLKGSKLIKINRVQVTDLSNITSRLPSVESIPIDGLLGYDFLKKHGLVLDFGSTTLYLR